MYMEMCIQSFKELMFLLYFNGLHKTWDKFAVVLIQVQKRAVYHVKALETS